MVVLWVGVCVCVCVCGAGFWSEDRGKLEVRLLGSRQEEGRWLWAGVLYRWWWWWYVNRVRFGRCNNH